MRKRFWSCAGLLVCALAWTASHAHAEDRDQLVVARVGETIISAGDVERRLRAMPDFQRATLGATPADVLHRLVHEVMVREALFAEGARARHLELAPGVRERIAQILRQARAEEVRRRVVVSPEDVALFFAQNHARFETPERIGVYRILCATEADARAVLDEAKSATDLSKWTQLARDRSLDKATQYRSGDLGFLAEDGSSNQVSVKVDPKLFSAAKTVRDGEIVPSPVPEGSAFAVVWRRGSLPAVHRSVEEESTAIRQVLERQKGEQALASLLAELRRAHPVETHPELIEALEVDAFGEVKSRPKQPSAAAHGAASALPSATPRGLR